MVTTGQMMWNMTVRANCIRESVTVSGRPSMEKSFWIFQASIDNVAINFILQEWLPTMGRLGAIISLSCFAFGGNPNPPSFSEAGFSIFFY